jgi:hypothetical protein
LAIAKIEEFYALFPQSRWHQAAYYYHLYHLNNAEKPARDAQLDQSLVVVVAPNILISPFYT